MKVSIIGTGYVGLVTGACLADVGNHVLCFDVDERKIDMLRDGEIPIYEPGLKEVVRDNVASGPPLVHHRCRRRARTYAHAADDRGRHAAGRGRLGRPAVRARRGAQHRARTWTARASSSTSPRCRSAPPTRCATRSPTTLAERGVDVPLRDGLQPRVPQGRRRGRGLHAARPHRDRRRRSGARIAAMRELYAPFQRNHERLQVMDIRSAELTKYAANAMLATRISFMNELALLAETLGADIEHVRNGIGSRPAHRLPVPLSRRRLRRLVLPQGRDGAACAPAQENGIDLQGRARGRGRQRAPEGRARRTRSCAASARTSTGKRFALWGLAFKPNTDDMREAPSRVVIDGAARARRARSRAYDPVAMDEARRIYGERAAR